MNLFEQKYSKTKPALTSNLMQSSNSFDQEVASLLLTRFPLLPNYNIIKLNWQVCM